MLRITVVTIFPEFFQAPLAVSIPARAAAAGAVSYRIVDLRDYTHDRHRTVDDYPYGGGSGMVMKPAPFFEAVDALGLRAPIVLLSARGERFVHADAVRYAAGEELTLLCGHYKDVDQRVADFLATEERSSGDRCDGATPSRRDVGPRERAWRLLLRSRLERAKLHPSSGLSRALCARRFALRRPSADRGVAEGAGKGRQGSWARRGSGLAHRLQRSLFPPALSVANLLVCRL
jgi:tRNA (Guanine-1)-methyltransferase